MSMAKFSELLPELIESFMKRLTCIDDCVRAAAACQSWHSAFAATRKRPHFSPWLMQTNDDTDAENLRTFSCLSSNREFAFELPGIQDNRCWGTPFSWMVTCDLDLSFHLINPISGARLPLPPQSTFPTQFPETTPPELMKHPEWLQKICPRRFVLSSNPSFSLTPDSNHNQTCIVVALYYPEGHLCFARPGDRAWTPIETTLWAADAIYFNGLVYAIDRQRGFLMVCDINTPHPKGTRIESSPPYDIGRWPSVYLIDMREEIHLVVRYIDTITDNIYYTTESLYVYRFDFNTKDWTEVVDLGDDALFVGDNYSFVISTINYPDLKPNAIYYTDDNLMNYEKNFCDMAVYDFGKKTGEPFYMGTNVTSVFSRPLFILPSL